MRWNLENPPVVDVAGIAMMVRPIRFVADAVVTVMLAAVLLAVYWVEGQGLFKHELSDEDRGKEDRPPDRPPGPPRLKLAVTSSQYDEMGKLLGDLGEGYEFDVIDEAVLTDPTRLHEFDAVFLTCNEPKSPPTQGLPQSLLSYVRDHGGTLYASDMQFGTLREAFSEYVDTNKVAQGLDKNIVATVEDADLRSLLGDRTQLHFDLERWSPAAFKGEGVTTYLKGSFRIDGGTTMEAPLLVKIACGKGTLFFTSFHNAKQNTELEKKLLKYLVLSTVTAAVEARANEDMVRGGFSPQTRSLLSVTSGEESVTRTYRHSQAGPLKFTLAFEPRGARLRLEVVAPDGQKRVREGESTITIDVPEAAHGPWQYTVAAVQVPYANYPFLMTVGAKRPISSDLTTKKAPDPGGLSGGDIVRFREIPLGTVAPERPRKLRIGVTRPQFDDMGKLLKKLGTGYQYEDVRDEELIDPPALDRFDVLFLTCGGTPESWAETLKGEAGHTGIVVAKIRADFREKYGEALRRFVARGGTLYVSDIRDDMIYVAFENRRPPTRPNLAILTQVEEAEREWIRLMAPTAKVGTVRETLRNADLSRDVQNNFDLILAVVESSGLLDGGLHRGARDNAARMVGTALQVLSPPVAERDVQVMARELAKWERAIHEGYSARSRTKASLARLNEARPRIQEAQIRWKTLRDRILNAPSGLGPQIVTARVVDPGLREALGASTITLNFNENGWAPARFHGAGVTVYMEGDFEPAVAPDPSAGPPRATASAKSAPPARKGSGPPPSRELIKAPLLVKFSEGMGIVIFTSFHNEKVNTEVESKLLRHLVFTAVTAKEEASVDKPLLSGGFAPTRRSLRSHSPGSPSVPGTHRTTHAGPLRFALTFNGQGARLRFTLVAPNGQKFEKEVESTLVVEAAGAPAGEWSYTVTALTVPFENFPFVVSVGEISATPQ